MIAKKGNMRYTISEQEKPSYIKDGYDIYDEEGKLVANGKGKTVTKEAYDALEKELEELKEGAEIKEEEILPILIEYASIKKISIGNAKKVKTILEKIKEAGKEQ